MVEEKEQYKLFCDSFSKNLERSVKALSASLSKGMGYYSKSISYIWEVALMKIVCFACDDRAQQSA